MANSSAEAMGEDITDIPQTDDAPPPYHSKASNSHSNPGFCPLAFTERHANRIPNGGMPSSEYFLPCKECGFVCGDAIPAVYKQGWPDWVDPSVNFRWESHIAFNKEGKEGWKPVEGREEAGEEKLGCWICWEYDGKWVDGMEVKEWYKHMRRHFFVEGYRICRGKTGGMQRRRNCEVVHCPKIHS